MLSCVIPTWRRPAWMLERAIRSTQGLADEVVVVVDREQEPFDADERVRIVHSSRPGIGAAFNAGLATVRGEYVGLLASDDEWLPAKAGQLPPVGPATCTAWTDDEGTLHGGAGAIGIYEDNAVCVNTFLLSRAALDVVGGFDESLCYAEDWDWSLRVHRRIGWTALPIVTAILHEHPARWTHQCDRAAIGESRSRVATRARAMRPWR